MIKLCENFSPGSSLNQSQTYQGNPCGVYPNLSSLSGSGVIQNSVTYIKWSAPNKDHIIRYQSFGSCYRFYPIQFLFFSFCNLSQVHVLFCYLHSCLRSCLHSSLCLVAFLFASYYVLVCVLLCSYFCSCSCSCSCFFQILCRRNYFWILFQILLQILLQILFQLLLQI